MKRFFSDLVKAILAGAAIGIGGSVYLSVDNKIVGAVMFAVGLYIICVQGLNLYTGKIGYAVNESRAYLPFLGTVWLGNLIGTAASGLLIRQTRVAGMAEKAAALCAVKDADSLLSLFVLGVFCGILMYAAVDSYKKTQNPLILFFCVAVFILCGFEHVVADMFYYAVAGCWSAGAILRLATITAGNSLGGMLIPLGQKLSA